MEEQDRQVNRPVDLARYEESMERVEQRERDEAQQQQQLEPPYGLTGTPLQLDDETRQLISDSSVEAGDRTRGRTTEVAELGPTLARMEVRMDNSPGRQSVGWESAPSRQSGHFKDDSVTQRVDMDDRELVPDYSGLPQGPVSSTQAVETEGLIPGRAPRASEGSSGSQLTAIRYLGGPGRTLIEPEIVPNPPLHSAQIHFCQNNRNPLFLRTSLLPGLVRSY